MEQSVERSDVEVIELEEGQDPFTPGKLVGVAVAGAFASLVLYYLVYQVEPDKRARLKDGVMSALKGQVRRWGEEEP